VLYWTVAGSAGFGSVDEIVLVGDGEAAEEGVGEGEVEVTDGVGVPGAVQPAPPPITKASPKRKTRNILLFCCISILLFLTTILPLLIIPRI